MRRGRRGGGAAHRDVRDAVLEVLRATHHESPRCIETRHLGLGVEHERRARGAGQDIVHEQPGQPPAPDIYPGADPADPQTAVRFGQHPQVGGGSVGVGQPEMLGRRVDVATVEPRGRGTSAPPRTRRTAAGPDRAG